MYKIDTEAEASVTAAAASSSTPPSETTPSSPAKEDPVPVEVKQAAATTSTSSHRTPSIKFLGKEGWARLKAGVQTPAVVHIPPNYGRPAISEAEMDALVMGGASVAPEVKVHSSGAMFG